MKKQKMAEGGEVGDGTMQNHPTLEALRRILSQPSASGPELKGFHDMMAKASGRGEEPATSKTDPEQEPVKMFDGGDTPEQINPDGTTGPQPNALQHSLSQLNPMNLISAPINGTMSWLQGHGLMTPKVDLSQLPPDPSSDQSQLDQVMGGTGGSPLPKPPTATSTPQPSQVLQQAQSAPPTNYDFYGDVNSDKVAALYKQLLAQKSSPGNLLASGAAGLGDAISNSFGHGGAHAAQDVQAIGDKDIADKMGAANQQRGQKLQDMQANTEQGLNDPNSSISQSMRSLFQKQGIKVPSGMPATLMMKLAPDLGDLALKQATLQSTNAFRGAELGLRGGELKERQDAEKEKTNEAHANHWVLNALGAYPGDEQPAGGSNPYQAELDRRRKSNG